MTPQNAASHLGLFCLHGEISSKNEIKKKKKKKKKKKNRIDPGAPNTRIGIAQMIRMGKSIRQNWVKLPENADYIQIRYLVSCYFITKQAAEVDGFYLNVCIHVVRIMLDLLHV